MVATTEGTEISNRSMPSRVPTLGMIEIGENGRSSTSGKPASAITSDKKIFKSLGRFVMLASEVEEISGDGFGDEALPPCITGTFSSN